MAIKLHRCRNVWVKLQGHPCWRVQSALDKSGIDYEVVKGPLSRGKRTEVERLSGQTEYPVIEFEDGTFYREQSKQMAERISSGKLFEARGAGAVAAPEAPPAEEHVHEHGHEHGADHTH
jgi:hypothetical protein